MRVLILKKSSIIRIAVFVVVLVSAVVFAKLSISADSPTLGQQGVLMPVMNVDTSQNAVAITIDTSFGDDYTEDILGILKKNKVKATFAVLGAWAEQNPGLVEKIAAEGHEIISHSMNHDRYTDLDANTIKQDVEESINTISEITGEAVDKIRAPYGTYDEQTLKVLNEMEIMPVKWSIDSEDWQGIGAKAVASHVVSELKEGDIIMFQNNSADTGKALTSVLKTIKKRDFACVTLSELFYPDYEIDKDGVMKAANN